jgi:transposase InsO family protein
MICRTLRIGRGTAYRGLKGRQRRYHRREDPLVVGQLRQVLRDRGSYGHRRARVLVNRTFQTCYGRERIRRLMRMYGLAVPVRGRRRNGRPHRGLIRREAPNERCCSDVLEIACFNGEVVHLAFALDCCDAKRYVP